MGVLPMTELRSIPTIGANMEEHLIRLGYSTLDSLTGQDPEEMYERDVQLHGGHLDRCVVYVYRLAVYYAENRHNLDPDKCRWWAWKD